MNELSTVLPILIYILLAALLVVLIILGIKAIDFMDRTNRILDNVEAKVNSLNGLFGVIDKFTDGLSSVTNKMVDGITNIITHKFKRKNKKKEEDLYE